MVRLLESDHTTADGGNADLDYLPLLASVQDDMASMAHGGFQAEPAGTKGTLSLSLCPSRHALGSMHLRLMARQSLLSQNFMLFSKQMAETIML